ncbi:MAG: hypothetical protein FJ096_23270, partial [Deltaproteobacteria bacterium]|nr:hypothetical protein [Deltaproteobacteria bacterium]
MGKEHPRGVPPTDIAAVYLEDLADPKEVGNVPRRMDHTDVLARCAALLETHREPYNPRSSYAEQPSPVPSYSAAEVLQTCIPLRYAFVLKTLAYVEPS